MESVKKTPSFSNVNHCARTATALRSHASSCEHCSKSCCKNVQFFNLGLNECTVIKDNAQIPELTRREKIKTFMSGYS